MFRVFSTSEKDDWVIFSRPGHMINSCGAVRPKSLKRLITLPKFNIQFAPEFSYQNPIVKDRFGGIYVKFLSIYMYI